MSAPPAPAPSACRDRKLLTNRYAAVTAKYATAVARLAEHRGTTSDPEYLRLQAEVEEARMETEGTALVLDRHIAMHGC